ncbi:putative nucleotidyltransferase, Ribonuclease H [Aduncisulcus paluster]|uniref:Nucleotidyltransferase, Ribonuclease H n=1 Tax=Aduncisulcus paluster TaxID=2918883 RepID=A0ABQ5KS64_9EUKA|nr:putative nucleotidyltransferase, Ribonuclease H [Aduncisulcus paluster]
MLFKFGAFYFQKFRERFDSYRALGGTAPLVVLIQPDIRTIYENVCDCLLPESEVSDGAGCEEEERSFLKSVSDYFGKKSALDTLYRLDTVKLFTISTEQVTNYCKRYREALRLMDPDDEISGDVLYSHFMRGIKHPKFRIRMEAALQGEEKTISTFIKVIYRQLAIVLETREDARGYEEHEKKYPNKKGAGGERTKEIKDDQARRKNVRDQLSRRRTFSDKRSRGCYICGEVGHIARNCPNSTPDSSKRRYSLKAATSKKESDEKRVSKPDSPYLHTLVWFESIKEASTLVTLLDTGAQVNIISEDVLCRLSGFSEEYLEETNECLELADGTELRVRHKCKLNLQMPENKHGRKLHFSFEAWVMRTNPRVPHGLILGYPLISEIDLFDYLRRPIPATYMTFYDVGLEELLLSNRRDVGETKLDIYHGFRVNSEFLDEVTPILKDFLQHFEEGEKKLLPELKIKLKEGCDFKTKQLRRTPFKYRSFIREEIKELVASGVIDESDNPFFSPLVIVPKKEGKLRMCVDYRELNSITIPYRHPLPRIDDCIEALDGQKLFACLDLSKGFHHVPIARDSTALTAFCTPFGQYEYLFMPFGLVNAPSHFQFCMNRVFEGLIGRCCVVYIDDVLIFGKDIGSLLENLKKVLDRIREWNLHINIPKCIIGAESIEFLGFSISRLGRRVLDRRIKGIVSLKAPTNKSEMRSFLGLVNFVRDFVPRCATLCAPLYELTEKERDFEWDKNAQEVFDLVKDALKDSVTLDFISEDAELSVFTDASDFGIGAVLIQKRQGRCTPVAFISKALNVTQRRWSVYEKEAWSIVYAIKKWDCFLRGREFTIFTDHKNLTYIEKSENAKVIRWFLLLQGYRYKIVHVSGKKNGAADALSRLISAFSASAASLRRKFDQENEVIKKVREVQAEKITDELKKELKLDKNGIWERDDETVWIPEDEDLHNTLIEQAHSSFIGGHKGINATLKRLKKWRIGWKGMRRDISAFHFCRPTLLRHELKKLAASAEGEFVIEAIVDHKGDTRENLQFQVQWFGYDPSENTWEYLWNVRDSIALEKYLEDHQEVGEMLEDK